MTDFLSALGPAQKLTSAIVQPSSTAIPTAVDGATDVGSIAEVLAGMGKSSIASLNRAEAVSMNALQGNADPRQVVDAVLSAEQSLQIAVAVRDKVVAAYLEISRMAI